MSQSRRSTPPPAKLDRLPPHSIEAEQGVLGCILLSPAECWRHLQTIAAAPEWFYDLRHSELFETLFALHRERVPADLITVRKRLNDAKRLEAVGGLPYLSGLMDAVPSAANLEYYMAIVREKWHLRKRLAACAEFIAEVNAHEGEAEPLFVRLKRTMDLLAVEQAGPKNRLRVRRCSDLQAYTPPPGIDLVGNAEIRKGQEGLVVIAGPGGAGKSLLVATLALAGAIGKGTWQGRKVHRRFKTLIVQAEVGPSRLKKTIEGFARAHPQADIEGHILFTDPPEGGMGVGDLEFWSEVAVAVADLQPDLVIIDPWSHLGVKDDSCEVMEALRMLRRTVGGGEAGPGIIIVAHTKKPRDERAARGRNLAHIVSGSVALVNTSRCTYIVLPWDEEDLEDQRVYFACPKINDGENFAPTVWHRRFGTFFDHDSQTDPRRWGIRDEEDAGRRVFSETHLRRVFEDADTPALTASELARALVKFAGRGSVPTATRAVAREGAGNYLAHLIEHGPGGLLSLKG